MPDAPPVGLELGLTRTTQTHAAVAAARTATGLPGQRVTPTTQAWQEVLQLSQLEAPVSSTTPDSSRTLPEPM